MKKMFIFLIIITFIVTGCGNKKLIKENEKLKNDIIILKDENTDFLNRIEILNRKIRDLQSPLKPDENSKEECTFIRTYRLINVLDYQTQEEYGKVLALDVFQGSFPILLMVKLDTTNLKQGKYYEFTFKGFKTNYTDIDNSLRSFDVIKIEPTDKIAFDQINQTCR